VSELDDIIQRQVAVDFDDTIAIDVMGDIVPTKGAKEAMTKLWQKGYLIVIHSSRSWEGFVDRGERTRWMAEWLHKHRIPYHKIHVGYGKPAAVAYIDDKAIKYDGNWEDIVNWLSARKGIELSGGKTGVDK
jgi:hypothetical protein